MSDNKLAIKVKEIDNVATIFANGVKNGDEIEIHDHKGDITKTIVSVHVKDGDEIIEVVPFGHKIAVRDIKNGELIYKYGEEIGIATKDIKQGEYVHVHNVDPMRGRGDLDEDFRPGRDSDEKAGEARKVKEDHKKYKFYGYKRPDGKYGARNYVAVIPTVACADDVANKISETVQGTVTFLHREGCCQLPSDLKRVTDTLIGLGKSPNIGAILIVSLGCEGTDHKRMYEELKATGKHVEIIHIQQLGGATKAIMRGTDIARELVIECSGMMREETDLSNVVMAIKCGASDATSGLASNCAIGYVADKLVDLGATVIFGETTEFIGGEHLLARRAVNDEVADKIYGIVDDMEKRAKDAGEDMREGQPTPGNIAGGLTTIEEKSLGAIVKSGTRTIQGVMDYTTSVTTQKGLWIKDSPGFEPHILTGMGATGAQFMCFSTGRGAPQGFPSMPVIKICGNPNTYSCQSAEMDINAGTVITGEKSVEEVGEEVFEALIRVLNGQMTKSETIRYYQSIDIWTRHPHI